jgi:hypothetical protein
MIGWQRFALAVFASLLLHLALIVGPGWRVPTLNDMLLPESTPQLEAHLVTQRRSAVQPPQPATQPAPRPPVKQRSPKALAAPPGVLAMPEVAEPQLAMSGMASFAPTLAVPADPAKVANAADTTNAVAVGESKAVAPPDVVAPPVSPAHSAAMPVEMSLPRNGSIRFSVEKGFVVGQSVHRWSHDGKEYSLSSLTQTTGLAAFFQPVHLTWTSTGTLDGAGLRPHEFRVEKNGVAGDSADFDWTAMQLVLSAGAQQDVPLVSGAQDMLSVFYQLGMLLPALADQTSAGKTAVRTELMVATGRKFERYGFDVVGEEKLSLKFGKYRTVHLRTASGKEATEVWLAPALRNLPVKIRITDRRGDSYDQIAESVEFEGMPGIAGHH